MIDSKKRYKAVFRWLLLIIRIIAFLLILLWPGSAF